MGKSIDYDGIIKYYDDLNKKRALTTEESDRLAFLVQARQKSINHKIYRAKNAEKFKLKAKLDYAAKDKAKANAKWREFYMNNPALIRKYRERASGWRAANPEKQALYAQRKREKRARERAAKESQQTS